MIETPKKDEGPGKPMVFLLFAAVFVVLAILGYIYEDELFIRRPYRDIISHSTNVYFIGILVFSVLGAFACLFCFLNPKFGNQILGREVTPPPSDPKAKEATITYNVFADSTPSSVKFQHRKRKLARHERHKYAKQVKKKKK